MIMNHQPSLIPQILYVEDSSIVTNGNQKISTSVQSIITRYYFIYNKSLNTVKNALKLHFRLFSCIIHNSCSPGCVGHTANNQLHS